MDFTSEFQRRKAASGKSAKEIAEDCALSESTIFRYLNGKSVPPADIAQKILDYLGEFEEPLSVQMLCDVYERRISAQAEMISQLRVDHEKDLHRLRMERFFLFGTLLVFMAVIVYLVIDASHGGWGFFRYSSDMLRTR